MIRVLEQVVAWRCQPQAICLDNGPEFLAERFITWCAERAIELRYIQPGKPDQNALIERYNRTYRTEVLNANVFESLDQVREISMEWLQSYNEERPHDALAGVPPATYRANLEARSSPNRSVSLTGELTVWLEDCRATLPVKILLEFKVMGFEVVDGHYYVRRGILASFH